MAKSKILCDNRFADSTPLASSTGTAAGLDVRNLADARPYTWWAPTTEPATVTVDCLTAKAADTACIVAHNLASMGCDVQIRGSTDGFSASDVLVASVTPSTDGPVWQAFASVSYRYWRLKIDGPGAPSLDHDYAGTKALPSGVTFARASVATYYDADGILRTAASGAARFDHNPRTGESLGLLIEEARTNLVTYSAVTNANWNDNVNGLITDAGTTAPDGSTSIRLTASASLGSTQVRATSPSFALASATVYTLSVFVKKGSMRYAFLISTGSAYTGTDPQIFFDFDTGTVSSSSASVTSSSVQALPDGWFRISMTAAATDAAANEQVMVGHTSASGVQTHAATAGEYTYFWGAQVEAGAFATSYIATVAASASRSTDVASVTGADFTAFYNQTAGSMRIDMRWKYVGVGSFAGGVAVSDNTSSEQLLFYRSGSGATPRLKVTDGGVDQANVDAVAVESDVEFISAFAYSANDFALSVDGAAVTTDAAGTLPTVDRMHLGDAAGGVTQKWIGRITYWPKRLTNAQLQWLTAADRGTVGLPSIAIAMIGTAMELPTGLEAPFDPIGRKLDGRRVQNNNGQPLGSIVDYSRWEQTITLRAVSWSWVRATWLPAFTAALQSDPFVFAWDPTTYPDEARLVTTDGDFATPHRSGSLCDLTVNLRGVA